MSNLKCYDVFLTFVSPSQRIPANPTYALKYTAYLVSEFTGEVDDLNTKQEKLPRPTLIGMQESEQQYRQKV